MRPNDIISLKLSKEDVTKSPYIFQLISTGVFVQPHDRMPVSKASENVIENGFRVHIGDVANGQHCLNQHYERM